MKFSPFVAAAIAVGLLGSAANGNQSRPAAVQADRFALSGQLVQGGLAIGVAPRGTTLLSLNGNPVDIAPDRRFLIAFDRDAPATAILAARLGNGSEIRQPLTIAPRAWDISRLNTLPKYPVPRPEFERARPAELAQINAARALRSDSQGWRQTFLWPVTGRISTLFGSQRIYRGEPGAYHSGIDIARPTGTVVLAPADGVVVLAAATPFTLEGNLLMIDHGMGLNTAFMHLSRIDVKLGQQVRRGQPVGAVGRTGRATGPHLHWSLKWRDARIDPLLIAGPMPVAD
ncbi:M23 family metallopeptidase [Sphingomonas psychrotolerans]|uniref:M23 family metallopeptidase n=1 Tax=Sphingomonas psychrotolerans TaxID=1327635 RepID=A0ABU3N5R5_9SPHN|nr:M23 family metallopeptidase [Sphingomonas psychrotolerans]MDT8759870.1 M23 family metallopeptidase [Sphingomonas psychrotolerans]